MRKLRYKIKLKSMQKQMTLRSNLKTIRENKVRKLEI